MATKLENTLAKADLKNLRGFGIAYSGGHSKAFPNCPDTYAERLRVEPELLGKVIAQIEKRYPNAKGSSRYPSLVANLLGNLDTNQRIAANASARAEKAKEKEEKAKEKVA